MKIKYVGVKPDGETAFSDKTGITWHPGDSFEVKDEHATRMLNHPDVFAKDEALTAANPAKVENTSGLSLAPGAQVNVPSPVTLTLPDGSVAELSVMDRDALHALAKDLGVKVHHQAGAAKVIEALTAANPAKVE